MEMFAADQKISASLATPLDPIDDLLAGKREIVPSQEIAFVLFTGVLLLR